jgi:hypothetical protein
VTFSKEKKKKAISLILGFILLAGVNQVFGQNDPNDNPIIASSPGPIKLDGSTTSKQFSIWNQGTGTLNYEVAVIGDDANYFTVEPEDGISLGINDKKTHTVTVNYDDVHNDTLHAQIEITSDDANSSPQYIELSATENIASRVSRILIEQGIDYGRLGNEQDPNTSCDGLGLKGDFDCDGDVDFNDLDIFCGQWLITASKIREDIYPDCGDKSVNFKDFSVLSKNWRKFKKPKTGVAYDFRLIVETDDKVIGGYFLTPEGREYTMDEANSGIWIYEVWFDNADGLADYGDGEYIITVQYADGEATTAVNFGILNKPGAISQPKQKPVLTNPSPGGQTISPIQFSWEQCTDSNVGLIRLNFKRKCGEGWIEQEFGKSTKKTGVFNLDIGEWLAELTFGRWYQGKNDDGIEIEVGKYSKSFAEFETMKWFGTVGGFRNHPLKQTDCNGSTVTFNLTGGGFGEIQGNCVFEKIILTGTTEKSVFSIKTQKGVKTIVGDIEADGDIRTMMGRGVNLEGNITIAGGARMIALNDVAGSREITINEPNSPKITACTLNFGLIDDLTLKSETPIRTLKATNWLAGSLSAPWIYTMTIKGNPAERIAGDFGANLQLNGVGGPKGMTLRNVKIAGELNGDWTIDGNCRTIAIASSSPDFSATISGNVATLKAVGNRKFEMPAILSGQWMFESVKSIKADDIIQCDLSAGVDSNEKNSATALGRITVKRWIKDTTITVEKDSNIGAIAAGALQNCNFVTAGSLGRLDVKSIITAYCFINSNIRAKHIGSTILRYPKYNNYGEPFGLTAGSIDKLTIKDTTQNKTWKKLQVGVEWIQIGDLEICLE